VGIVLSIDCAGYWTEVYEAALQKHHQTAAILSWDSVRRLTHPEEGSLYQDALSELACCLYSRWKHQQFYKQ
jgi:hypothetical protein